MSTPRASKRFLFGWFVISIGLMGQAPQLYGQGDPSCPNCQKGPAMGPHLPLAPQAPALDAPPAQMPVNDFSPEHSRGGPVQGIPVQGPAPIAGPGPVAGPVMSGQVEMDDCPIACVKLRIRAPACAEVGKEMEYRIKVENTTPTDAHNVTVKMSLPASVKILRASPQVHQREPDLQWNFGTIPGWGGHDIVVLIVPLGLADIKNCTRVTYEHGQCVTTKVMVMAPDGSADGRVPPGNIPGNDGFGRPGFPGGGPGGPGGGPGAFGGPRGDFDVRVFGPPTAQVGQDTTYTVTLFNNTDQPMFKAGVSLDWSNDFEFVRSSEDLTQVGGMRAWPKGGLFEVVPAKSSRSVVLTFKARAEGQLCVKANASASLTQDPRDNKIVNAKDEACTVFRRAIPGMTLEMFDKDDPILKNGKTSYPITVTNQGKDPIKNLRIKARVPELLEMSDVRGPVRYQRGMNDRREFWVEFEPLPTLNVGETQTYEIFVNAKGQTGEARFRVEMTADGLDKGPNNATRWIIEEESTTIVPDEEMRERIRQISRPTRSRQAPGLVTAQPSKSEK